MFDRVKIGIVEGGRSEAEFLHAQAVREDEGGAGLGAEAHCLELASRFAAIGNGHYAQVGGEGGGGMDGQTIDLRPPELGIVVGEGFDVDIVSAAFGEDSPTQSSCAEE